VNLLIDSHTLIWSYFDPSRLSSTARSEMTSTGNWVFVSAASVWEIAIKISTGKLSIAESFPDFIQHAIFDNGFILLPIEPRHATALIGLPYHHRDPFDRLLIAQAMIESIPIVSDDAAFDSYPVRRIW
jgi:PIN domain nuclease of toxin-antitoxin system